MNESAEARRMFLAQRLAWPLAGKVRHSEGLIREWYEKHEGKVYVSFSGGKDSTVLLHLVRRLYPDVPAVFIDTGLEFPEIREFVRTVPGVITLRPERRYQDIVSCEGWPVVSKQRARLIEQMRKGTCPGVYRLGMEGVTADGRPAGRWKLPERWKPLLAAPFKVSDRCCEITKKRPARRYGQASGRAPLIGTMVCDSLQRQTAWIATGCNVFSGHCPHSAPLSMWTEADIWDYLRGNEIPHCRIYDMGYTRTGCVLCAFGAHLEPAPNRFQRLAVTHPKLWEWGMHRLGMAEVLNYCGIAYKPERRLL